MKSVFCIEVKEVSKKCKRVIVALISMLCICIAIGVIKILFFSGLFVPLLKVKGENHIKVEVNQPYDDQGAIARYRFLDYSQYIEVNSNVDITKTGTYEVVYSLKDYHKQVTRKVEVVDTTPPNLQLQGPTSIRVFENTVYEEPGVKGIDNYDGDISDQIHIKSNVDMSKQGEYQITYSLSDRAGNISEIIRNVNVCQDPTNVKLYYNHDSYNNKAEEWWFEKSKNHERVKGAIDEEVLRTYDAYHQGPDEKVIYLTFDEGGNDITYIKEITKVLDDNDVDATFFLTRNYILNEPDFMNELVENGHLVANHTWHHYDMPTLANANDIDKFVLEITETEKAFMQVTGQEMKKIFRFPKGGSSLRSLKIMQDLGYRTYAWSHAFYDYGPDLSKEEVLKTMMDHYHNGAIYLLHPSNKGNYLAMDTFIKNMKALGYTFQTVDTIAAP